MTQFDQPGRSLALTWHANWMNWCDAWLQSRALLTTLFCRLSTLSYIRIHLQQGWQGCSGAGLRVPACGAADVCTRQLPGSCRCFTRPPAACAGADPYGQCRWRGTGALRSARRSPKHASKPELAQKRASKTKAHVEARSARPEALIEA